MPLVWVTGNSGVGKSSINEALQAAGFVSADTDDDGFCGWVDRVTGELIEDPPYPVPPGWLDRFGWRIVRDPVQRFATAAGADIAFLCGSAENEEDVRNLFDLIVCLVVDDETLRHRLATRTSNAFGQHPEELAAALQWNPRMRRTYEDLGACIIDATQPLGDVVDAVIRVSERATRERGSHRNSDNDKSRTPLEFEPGTEPSWRGSILQKFPELRRFWMT